MHLVTMCCFDPPREQFKLPHIYRSQSRYKDNGQVFEVVDQPSSIYLPNATDCNSAYLVFTKGIQKETRVFRDSIFPQAFLSFMPKSHERMDVPVPRCASGLYLRLHYEVLNYTAKREMRTVIEGAFIQEKTILQWRDWYESKFEFQEPEF